jgi:ECF sigma factor
VTFDQDLPIASDTTDDLIAIDEALQALAAQYSRKSQVVELRFFGGLSADSDASPAVPSQGSAEETARDRRRAHRDR